MQPEIVTRYLRLRVPERVESALENVARRAIGLGKNSGLGRIFALLGCPDAASAADLLLAVSYAQLYAKVNTDGSTAHYTNEPHRNFAQIEDTRLEILQHTEKNVRALWQARHRVLFRFLGTSSLSLHVLALMRHDELERNGTTLGPKELGEPVALSRTDQELHALAAELGQVPAALLQDMLCLETLERTAKQWLRAENSEDQVKALYQMAAALTVESGRAEALVTRRLQKSEQNLSRADLRIAKQSIDSEVSIPGAREYYSETLVLGDLRYQRKQTSGVQFLVLSEKAPRAVLNPVFWNLILQQMVCYELASLEARGAEEDGPERFWCVLTGDPLASPRDGLYVIYKFAYMPSIVLTVSLRYFEEQKQRIKLVVAGYTWKRIAELMPLRGAEYELARFFFRPDNSDARTDSAKQPMDAFQLFLDSPVETFGETAATRSGETSASTVVETSASTVVETSASTVVETSASTVVETSASTVVENIRVYSRRCGKADKRTGFDRQKRRERRQKTCGLSNDALGAARRRRRPVRFACKKKNQSPFLSYLKKKKKTNSQMICTPR